MNKVILMGRLTREVVLRYTSGADQKAIANYTLAVDRIGEGADFLPCVAFGKNAEFADKYLKKGTKVIIEGHLQTGSYMNREGNKVYTTDVIIEHQEFAESKSAAGGSNEESSDGFMAVPEDMAEEMPFM